MFPVIEFISTKIAFAPVYSTACEVAVCDIAGTITSSPFFKPIDKQDICNAAVQLETVNEYFELVNFLNSFSNKEVFFPCVSQPLFIVFFTNSKSELDILSFENFTH